MTGHAPNVSRPARPGFTLVELLVAIAIVGMLVSLLIPAVQSARSAAGRVACANNLRQLGLASQSYESAHGWLPDGQWRKVLGGPKYSCLAQLLPHLEEGALYQQIDFNQPIGARVNKGTEAAPGPTATIVSAVLCPEAASFHPTRVRGRIGDVDGGGESFDEGQMDGVGATDYLPVSGPHKRSQDAAGNVYGKNQGVFLSLDDDWSKHPRRLTSAQISVQDGLSYTMAMTECSGRGEGGGMHGCWPDGANVGSVGRDLGNQPAINMERGLAWQYEQPRSDHPGGVYVLLADGAVFFLTDGVDRFVLRALASRKGGERIANGVFP
jgi:prepilin-type N-terminal cleavage/methylation domain-containing protein